MEQRVKESQATYFHYTVFGLVVAVLGVAAYGGRGRVGRDR